MILTPVFFTGFSLFSNCLLFQPAIYKCSFSLSIWPLFVNVQYFYTHFEKPQNCLFEGASLDLLWDVRLYTWALLAFFWLYNVLINHMHLEIAQTTRFSLIYNKYMYLFYRVFWSLILKFPSPFVKVIHVCMCLSLCLYACIIIICMYCIDRKMFCVYFNIVDFVV